MQVSAFDAGVNELIQHLSSLQKGTRINHNHPESLLSLAPRPNKRLGHHARIRKRQYHIPLIQYLGAPMLRYELVAEVDAVAQVVVNDGDHEGAGFGVGRVGWEGRDLEFEVSDGVAHGDGQGAGLDEERDQGTQVRFQVSTNGLIRRRLVVPEHLKGGGKER